MLVLFLEENTVAADDVNCGWHHVGKPCLSAGKTRCQMLWRYDFY